MFRTAFKSAARQAWSPRAYSTRGARVFKPRGLVLAASFVASSLVFLPLASVDNDADKSKVDNDKRSTKLAAHDGKSNFSVENSSNKPSEVIPEDHPGKMPQRKASEKATENASDKAEKEGSEKATENASDKAEKEGSEKATENASDKAEKEDSEKKDSGTDSNGQGNDEGTEPSEEEQSGEQGAAYNPETGEINWDCPCLGGMAHGPCGEEFKTAFSCFIYSETEPKGIDCIEKFEAMRTCFRQHPEHYKEELYEDDEPASSTVTDEKPPSDQHEHTDPGSPSSASSQEPAATEDISKVA